MPSTIEQKLGEHFEQDQQDFDEIRKELTRLNSLRAWAAGCFFVVSLISFAVWQVGPFLIRSAVRDAVENLNVATSHDIRKLEYRLDSLERHTSGAHP